MSGQAQNQAKNDLFAKFDFCFLFYIIMRIFEEYTGQKPRSVHLDKDASGKRKNFTTDLIKEASLNIIKAALCRIVDDFRLEDKNGTKPDKKTIMLVVSRSRQERRIFFGVVQANFESATKFDST